MSIVTERGKIQLCSDIAGATITTVASALPKVKLFPRSDSFHVFAFNKWAHCVISVFRRGVNEILTLLGCYTV